MDAGIIIALVGAAFLVGNAIYRIARPETWWRPLPNRKMEWLVGEDPWAWYVRRAVERGDSPPAQPTVLLVSSAQALVTLIILAVALVASV